MNKLKKKMQILQKGISSIKGANEIIDMNAFSFYHEAWLPQRFKLLPIIKFNGITPLKTYLQSYI